MTAHRAKTRERARAKQRLHREGYCFYHCFRPCRQQKTRKQAGGKEEEKLGREGRVKEKQNRGEKAVAVLVG